MLIVDDVQANRDLLREWLTPTGLEVLEGMEGEQAIRMARAEQPDVILLDLHMPAMDGYSALKLLRAEARTAAIPVFVMTATATSEEAAKAERAGFNGYLTKPLDVQTLLVELSRFLPRKDSEPTEPDTATTKEEASAGFRPQNAGQTPQLREHLRTEFIPVWETLTGAMDMDDIEEFAEQLLTVSDTYQARGLQRYAEQLRDWAQQFDIVHLETMLREFPGAVAQLDD